MKKVGLQVVAFVGGLVIFFGLGWLIFGADLNRFKEEVKGQDTVAVVHFSGGLCADGKICESEFKIKKDGSFEKHDSLTADEVTQLTKLVEDSDLRGLEVALLDERDCPSFYDGQDVSFSFPGKYGDEMFTLCNLKNPEVDPLLSFMVKVVSSKQH